MFKSHVLKSVIFAMLASGSAAVAATSDVVNIGGHVSSSLSVAATPTSGVSTLDLSGGEKIVKIADVAMGTNNETGLTLTVTPHPMTKTGGTTITVKVTTVDDGDDPPLTGAFSTGAFEVGSSGSGPFAQDLYIKYTPLNLQDPGDYAGTVDLSVSDN
jgi:hypothetical protein